MKREFKAREAMERAHGGAIFFHVEEQCKLQSLPAELVEHICGYCSPEEILALSLSVAKFLWLQQNYRLWKRQIAAYFPNIYHWCVIHAFAIR